MRFCLLYFMMLCAVGTSAQEVLNNNPPSLKWNKINTPHFRILFPQGFEYQAQRMANTMEHIREAESKTLGVSTKRISIILQNQTAVSNGFVSLIPRRSEFYAMPPQDYNFSGTTEWLDQLASHEYRHVVQFDKAKTGFNKLLYYMFGPATLAAMSVTAVPQWFWEGDAVLTETAFTHGGRGRVPNFGLVFRTNFMEGRTFNYHKQYLRSYKHNIPDHYVFGYHMVSFLRERTGDPFIWEKITNRAWRVPFIPFTFSNAIKKETGLYVTDLYNEMASDLQRNWNQQASVLEITPFEKINTRSDESYTDFLYPQVMQDGSVLIMKRGIGDISQFFVLKDQKEKKSFIPGILNDAGMLSANGNYVVWNEYGFHPRWRMKSYSLIKMYDVQAKKLKVISSESRYAGASLSPDQTKVVTVETNTTYTTALIVLDTAGNVVKQFSNPDNAFYSMPRWSIEGGRIVALKTTPKGRTISVFNLQRAEEEELFPYSNENIGHPVLHGNHLFYNSPISGIDNIYVYDLEKKERLQVTSSKYGAYNPAVSPNGKFIYYNEQTRDGMDVVRINYDQAQWKSFEIKREPKSFYQLIAEQEGRPNLFDSIPQQQYATDGYSKISGVINPYSWGVYFNSDLTQADIGISSQDIMSTTVLKAGYLYDINERTGAWRVGVSYQNWFPIVDVNFKFGNRASSETLVFQAIDTVSVDSIRTFYFSDDINFEWKEKNLEAGLRIPLVTTRSRYISNVTFGNYVGYTQVTDYSNDVNNSRIIPFLFRSGPSTPPTPSLDSGFYLLRTYQDNGNLLYNRFMFSASRLLKQSRRDINSKWGQSVYLNWYATPYGGDFSGNQFSFYTVMYFPGLFKHHSLWGYWGFQGTDYPIGSDVRSNLDTYVFNNQIPLPRGVSIARFQKFYSMSANYTLPVWYPDAAIGPVLNIQRVRFNGFIDYGFGSSVAPNVAVSRTYLTVGGEVKFDFNFMRLLNQFNAGFRYTYGIEPSVTNFEFLLGTIGF